MTSRPTSPPSRDLPGSPVRGRRAQAEPYEPELEIVANNATVALFVMDEKQECTYMNPAAERLTGYTLSEVRGRPLHDVIHYQHPDGTPYPIEECPIDRAFPENMQEQGEDVFIHKDGTFYPVAYTASPIQEGGRTIGTIIEVRDIRRERELAADRERAIEALREESNTLETINRVNATLAAELNLEKLIKAVTDAGTELTGAQFGAFFYNAYNEQGELYMLYTLSGVPREEFSRFPMPRNTPVFHPTFSGESIVRSDDITEDPRYGQTPPYYGMPEGHLPVRSYLAVPVIARSGEVLGGLFFGHEDRGVFTDRAERIVAGIANQAAIAVENARLFQTAELELSERRRAEKELKELNETLEARVNERTAQLQARNRELQEFAYVASHDLQEPLRKVHSYAELVLDEYGSRMGEDGRSFLHRMQDATQRMTTLIKDLLAYSRVATTDQPLEIVDLNVIIDEVLSDLQVRLEETGGRVEVDDLRALRADPVQMRQLFQNLIGNALKFHRPDVRPHIRVSGRTAPHHAGGQQHEAYHLEVSDNGIGFEQAFADRIFAPFQRLHGRDSYQGTGIGLAICRRIAERHGGTISARSNPGEGSTFEIVLPMQTSTDGAVQEP